MYIMFISLRILTELLLIFVALKSMQKSKRNLESKIEGFLLLYYFIYWLLLDFLHCLGNMDLLYLLLNQNR